MLDNHCTTNYNQYVQDRSDTLKVLTVSGKVEKIIADSVQQTEHGNYLSMDPNNSQAILESIAKEVERVALHGTIACSFMFTSCSNVC